MKSSSYQSLLDSFFSTEVITDYSLEKIQKACEHFGNPKKSFRSIHIAGTNGKGSTAKMIFQILKDSGKKVGVFTSPHLLDIRERFETEDGLISEEEFSRLAGAIIEYGGGLSYYDRCTLLAFLYFCEQKCEYAVIEVGMGGRLDATNIITPILSIITSISYDHMEWLGDTLEAIATEKGGILKADIPVILFGENPTLEAIAHSRHSLLLDRYAGEIQTNLAGDHQIQNARLAFTAGIFLGLSEDQIRSALMRVRHLGRLEYVRANLLIDGAHNADGLEKLRVFLEDESRNWKQVSYCWNLKQGKSPTLITDTFSEITEYSIIESRGYQVTPAIEMSRAVRNLGKRVEILTPTEIVLRAEKNPETLFVCFGSLYMIGEFL